MGSSTLSEEKDDMPSLLNNAKDKKEDFLGCLPDEILSHILSFLPIGDAVRTSVLSKSWIHHWEFITSLHFDQNTFLHRCPYKPTPFDQNLINRFCSPNFHSFTLSIPDNTYNYKFFIESWISFAVEGKVQRVDITYPLLEYPLVSRLFQCKTLVELTLQDHKSYHTQLPLPLHHPTLQKLNLSGFVIVSSFFTPSSSSHEAVLDFPAVKVFELNSYMCLEEEKLRINTPRAERFVLIQTNRYFDRHSIEVYAPSITKLTLKLFSSPIKFLPLIPPSILKASIGLGVDQGYPLKQYMNSLAIKLVQNLHLVKHLKLHLDVMQILSHGSNFGKNLPVFSNLVLLEIDCDIASSQLLLILHKSPNLESLICKQLSINDDWVENPEVPYCFLSRLKRVTLKASPNEKKWYSLPKFVLENAKVLQLMTIIVTSEVDLKEIEENLLIFPTGSRQLILDIIEESFNL